MSDFPIRTERLDPIDRQTRKLIDDAERAAAMHNADLTGFARQILAGRKQRERYFDPMLFSNPAWDILLGLYVAEGEGRRLSLIECSTASTVPQGVALRWLAYFKQEEMVVEASDLPRPNKSVIRLTDETRMAVSAYLGSLFSLGLGPEPAIPDIPRAAG